MSTDVQVTIAFWFRIVHYEYFFEYSNDDDTNIQNGIRLGVRDYVKSQFKKRSVYYNAHLYSSLHIIIIWYVNKVVQIYTETSINWEKFSYSSHTQVILDVCNNLACEQSRISIK